MSETHHNTSEGGVAAAAALAAAASGVAAAEASLPLAMMASLSEQGRHLCNTAPQSIQFPFEDHPNCLVSGGLDWLSFSWWIAWREWSFALLFNQLRDLKERAQTENVDRVGDFLLGNIPVFVFRSGYRSGGERGSQFKYKISLGGISIGLSDRQCSDGDKERPNCHVRLTGHDCLVHGAWYSYDVLKNAIEKLGGDVQKETVSRVDACIDIANLPVETLQGLVQRRQFITRLKNVVPYVNLVDNVQSGFAAGKHPQRLIVYDKLLEVLGKADQEYAQALIQRRYAGQVPEHALRVEVQLSRQCLLKYGVDSPGDARTHTAAAVHRFLSDSFRIVDQTIPVGSKNHSRANVHPLWSAIQRGFEDVFGEPGDCPAAIDRSTVNPQQLVRQAIGCLRNVLLQQGVDLANYEEFCQHCVEQMQRIHALETSRQAFVEEYQLRLTEHLR